MAPYESHELAEAVLRGAGAHVPRGCLLRRVNADLTVSLSTEMSSTSYRVLLVRHIVLYA